MSEQNFANHAKFVPAFHFFLAPILLITAAAEHGVAAERRDRGVFGIET
jgi:hypothetical protein